jgi:hypothetical protein
VTQQPDHQPERSAAPGGPPPGKRVDDESRTAEQARADALPDGSPLRPGLAASTVDPATGESHTGQ